VTDLTVAAMKRIAGETDRFGSSPFPQFMLESMSAWAREGLVTINRNDNTAKITAAGRRLAETS